MSDTIVFTQTSIPTDLPQDESPPTVDDSGGSYNPEYPGSTPDAPYGYKPDGTPYRRRPKGTAGGKSSGKSRNTASTPQAARTAAGLLAQLNTVIGIGLMAFGMPQTAGSIAEANSQFEEMAYTALLNDPALCKRILNIGATSGKGGLILAYGMLGMNMFPSFRDEVRAKREAGMVYDDAA